MISSGKINRCLHFYDISLLHLLRSGRLFGTGGQGLVQAGVDEGEPLLPAALGLGLLEQDVQLPQLVPQLRQQGLVVAGRTEPGGQGEGLVILRTRTRTERLSRPRIYSTSLPASGRLPNSRQFGKCQPSSFV